ncbi:AglZ/HisF2 family acetamidino modification protein [Adhaeribacter soli]|uniref:imidazole glycerol-phosphate synthase n=1 Tax=Adhaeribacter soli TaxID=2607655 RepID=A0A5N1IP45_9BACT|nr:AglZ/HisF2 family acetamidino modification protein [Adhaeribacter soli]KAA9327403.1 imidazole glycerol phosphate synthase subunit HisF [Adhaeribacter soli]
MLKTRVIPCLQLIGDSLVKTVKFNKFGYIGDPINTVRIFNELEVDELCFLDIRATLEKRKPNLELLKQIADECFMPLSYGGGVTSAAMAQQILSIGFEKIVLNTVTFDHPEIIREIADHSGVQSVVGSIDVKKNFWGKYKVYSNDGKRQHDFDPVTWAKKLEQNGVGEILLTSMDHDGTWSGYDTILIKQITEAVNIPVIANGGAGQINDIVKAVETGASAVALGSMVVYQAKGLGVLVNFPDRNKLEEAISR